MKKMSGLFLSMLLAVSVVFIGCSSSSPSSTVSGNQPAAESSAKGENQLRIAISSSPPNLDSHLSTLAIVQIVGSNLFETLVTIDKEYKVIPMLAEKIEVSPDGKTITFPLRKGVKFHNGKEMVADDVVASLKRWGQLASTRAALDNVEIVAKDSHTVQFIMKAPNSSVLGAIASPAQPAVIMPKEVIDSATKQGVKEYIGTGPYKLIEWKQDQYIHLQKYADYQTVDMPSTGLGGKKQAKINDLFYYIVPDQATRVAGMQSGEYDFADDVPLDNYDQLKADPNLEAIVVKPKRSSMINLNLEGHVFGNQKMREAVSTALDRDAIMMAITGNPDFYRLDPGILYREQALYSDAGKDKFNPNNPELAKQLLKEAGYAGQEVKILTTNAYDYMYKTGIVVKDQLEKVGIKVKVEVYDWPTMIDLISDAKNVSKWDIYTTGFILNMDPSQAMYLDSRNNFSGGYHNPRMDALLDTFRTTINPAEQKTLADQIQTLYYEDLPIIKIGDLHALTVYNKKLKNFTYFIDMPFWNATVQ
ncbi:UNVERIFIED_CONTAM: peptide/nickel transport system substrate-binding protein [Brevibacillus sp. OAP136]